MKKDDVQSINLINVPENSSVEILQITGGYKSMQRLNDMGLFPGTQIKILRKGIMHGPVQLAVRNSQIVLGYGIASKIFVKPIERSSSENG